jgi:CheY-like chemotaxis protein
MLQSNSLKKIAIVDDAPGCFSIEGGKLKEQTLKEQVKCFRKASGLLSYLEELKQKHLVEDFPDYILIDIHLPDMDATFFLDSFARIVVNMETPEIFIFASSGNKKNRSLAMQYSFVSAYLEKPVPSDFIEVLIAGKGVDNSPH